MPEEKKAPSAFALEEAAKAWGKPETEKIVMDPVLATVFAEIIDELTIQPWLGRATTGQLIDEIKARVNLSYRTVDP